MDNTKIEWTDATWNPIKGCSPKSEGCRHCYAEGLAARFHKPDQWGHGLTEGGTWTGKVTLDEKAMTQPLRWKKPRRIFVNSLSDLFHDSVPDEWIDRIFAIMALCPQHTFQILTKRPERMREYLQDIERAREDAIDEQIKAVLTAQGYSWHERHRLNPAGGCTPLLPLPNVWLGISVENQKAADERIPALLATPAAVRFLSCEPLLGPVDFLKFFVEETDGTYRLLSHWYGPNGFDPTGSQPEITHRQIKPNPLDWVICGGESGPHARPMHPDWARSLRDQCAAAGVPFFFKQWGEWEADEIGREDARSSRFPINHVEFRKVGKARAGRLLGGQTHDDVPGSAAE
jgi:protein gp37